MRIAAREIEPTIVVMPDTARPIRMRTGALTYMFTEAEAIDLANKLVDAVDEIRPPAKALEFFNTEGTHHD